MKYSVIFLFLFVLPSCFAFDCNTLNEDVRADCLYLNDVNESLIANLIYTNNFFANHNFVGDYNEDIVIQKPIEAPYQRTQYIKDAWVDILRVQPSVQYQNKLFVKNIFSVFSYYGYTPEIPQSITYDLKRKGKPCKTTYSLNSNSVTFEYILGNLKTSNIISTFSVSKPTNITAKIVISVSIKEKNYYWKYSNDHLKCLLESTRYSGSSLPLYDTIEVHPYYYNDSSFVIESKYNGNLKGTLQTENNNIVLNFSNGSYTEQNIQYGAIFTKSPNNYLQIVAEDTFNSKLDRVNEINSEIIAIDSEVCLLRQANFFKDYTIHCVENISEIKNTPFEKSKFSSQWKLFVVILVIAGVVFLSYIALRSTWGKYIPLFIIPLLLVPIVHAEDSECGLTNLGACLPEATFNFLNDFINSPIIPLVATTKFLLGETVSIDPFYGIWQIIVYIMGFFYLLMLTFVGFSFLTSGHNTIKRELAKEWLKNTFLVIIFTSASFYLYQLILEVSAVLTSSFLTTVPNDFFLLTIDNYSNVALQFLSRTSYGLILGITIILLAIRYIISSIGVIFVPVGLLCYFIPPLKGYGKLILNLFGMAIFLPVVNVLIIIACSKIIEVGAFSYFKILVMCSCFLIIDAVMIMALLHIVTKSGVGEAGQKILSAGKYIAALLG